RATPGPAAAKAPADFVLVEEPADVAATMDERIAEDAVALLYHVVETGILDLRVRVDRVDDVKRFFTTNTGLSLAVIVDDVAIAEIEMPPSDGKKVSLALGEAQAARASL